MPYYAWKEPDDPEGETQNFFDNTSRKSLIDVWGSWKLDRPLQDVQELRDQYRKILMIDDLEQKTD
ncbi:hypothetical protein NST41_33970 [Paenibacillus sp. FSL L8-0696]|uniref:hypothetical protein n=1 Tax=Paenibacillus sp. FSL L8-0696 TaxID=2954524 RepID=UPI00311A51FC